LIVRAKTTALAGVILLVAGVATACTFACVHEVGDFTNGRDTGLETDATPDGIADSSVDGDFDGDSDTAIDTRVPDSEPDSGDSTIADGDAMDAGCTVSATDSAIADGDAEPPVPEVSCTAIGPPNAICIAAATFSMGTARTACFGGAFASEAPEVTVKTSLFFIDEHEVSVGRFRTWWNLTTRTWPIPGQTIFTNGTLSLKWRPATGGNPWPTAPTEPAMAAGCTWRGASDGTNDDKPINCIDWYTALAFCMSDGKRLPTEAEWELVASAGEDRLFPWSAASTEKDPVNETDVTCAHALRGSCPPTTTPRDSTMFGRSKWGAWNMAGSVGEWTLDGFVSGYAAVTSGTLDPLLDPAGSTRVVRGGGHLAAAVNIRAAARASSSATTPDAQIGFRCAKR
jgi:sulfatase modifying factor 1